MHPYKDLRSIVVKLLTKMLVGWVRFPVAGPVPHVIWAGGGTSATYARWDQLVLINECHICAVGPLGINK